ncbi:MAG: putative RNA uridine N3 methyltransferase [Conexivisphaerales archaeon]
MTILHVALPTSLLMEDTDLRDKTIKLGHVARALAIFKVERVYIYRDPKQDRESDRRLIREMLEYLETPQYLRKKLFGLRPSLKYAGLLPPLKIPSHMKTSTLVPDEYREGVVEEKAGQKFVFVGSDFLVPFYGTASAGSRVTVQIEQTDNLSWLARQKQRDDIHEYWGYKVVYIDDIFSAPSKDCLMVATSRLGTPISVVWSQLVDTLSNNKSVLIIFGSPKRGLFDMFKENELRRHCHFILNTVEGQGVGTIRTEESLCITLSLFSLALSLGKSR